MSLKPIFQAVSKEINVFNLPTKQEKKNHKNQLSGHYSFANFDCQNILQQ